MEKPVRRIVGYLRVSTDKQAEKGTSLDIQREKIAGFAAVYSEGIELVSFVEDAGYSAKDLNRPGLSRVLAMLDAGEIDGLIVMKLDRLTRSVGDMSKLIEDYFAKGLGDLLSVSDMIDTHTASGRMILNLLTTVAQWERETIAERTRASMQHKIALKEYTGGILPLGWSIDPDGVHLVEHPEEQELVRRARALRGEGKTLREIAHLLGDVRGATLAPMQVSRILTPRGTPQVKRRKKRVA